MNISKKDKMVLVTLVFVLAIAVFIMYGVMPVNKELKAKQADYDKIKQEATTLKNEYNNPQNKPEAVLQKTEDMLMDFYLNVPYELVVDSILEDSIGGHDLKFRKLLEQVSLETKGFSKLGVIAENRVVEKIEIEGSVDPLDLECLELSQKYSFEFFAPDYDITFLTDYFAMLNDEKAIYYKNLALTYNKEEQIYKGTVVLYKYYIAEPEHLPKKLTGKISSENEAENRANANDAPNKPYEFNSVDNSFKFNTIQNAQYYEIYEVVEEKVEGKTKSNFVLVDTNIKPKAQTSTEVKYYNDGKLVSGKKYVITAVGNYKDAEAIKNGMPLYYRTILSEDLAREKAFQL